MQEPQIVHMRSRSQSEGRWSFEPVVVAATRLQRFRGLRPRSAGRGLMLRGTSVHGFGMREALMVVFLDPGGMVLGVERLLPGSLVRYGGATWVLELPPDSPIPQPGTTLEILRRSP